MNHSAKLKGSRGRPSAPRKPALPAVGARFIDRGTVTWTVAAVHEDGTPRVTVQAGGLRRTMTVERLAETMEPLR